MQDGIDASDMILLCPLATLSGSEKSRGITPTKTQTQKLPEYSKIDLFFHTTKSMTKYMKMTGAM